ncbi:MAG: hypothetical protein UIC65_01255, partial [Alphaproteobacteria bacterium]|nr:hypothetical protein [Alphaproteobacteria bacterium]
MKKAKDIINDINLTRIVMALAALLSLIAICLVVTRHTPSQKYAQKEHSSVVSVASGDTLSGLLLAQGLTHNDVNEIASVLKKEAGIAGLRAERDKLEFVRPNGNAPVSKIVV